MAQGLGDTRTAQSLAQLTNLRALFAGISAHHGKTRQRRQDDVQGPAGRRHPGSLADDSKLYVAATGKPYPVAIVGDKKGQSGAVTFDDWNKSVSLSAPSDALDISQFGG